LIAIRQYREKKGWTQEDVANRVGVAKTTVSMWETGDRKPDIITLKKLASIFECTTDDLLVPIEV
jgi:DNA-binding XRE family transcriptional regulator